MLKYTEIWVYRGSQSNSLSTTDWSLPNCNQDIKPDKISLQTHIQGCNPANLCYPTFSTSTGLEILRGVWNCQFPVKKADTISTCASLQTLHFLALPKTWINPENTATPAALSSAYSFSHTSFTHLLWCPSRKDLLQLSPLMAFPVSALPPLKMFSH